MYKKTICASTLSLLLGCANIAHADIKIGFLGTLSGPSADVGRDQFDGLSLALEELGGKLGGVAVTVVKEDDQQKPEVALNSLSKLIEKDKVDIVTGLTFSNVLMAIQNKVAATDIPFIGTVAGPSPIAGAQCKPNMFIMSWQSDSPAEVVGKYLSDIGVNRIVTLTLNYIGGKDKITGIKRFYKGELVDEIYTSLNQLDFSAELTQVTGANPQAVFAFYPGGQAVTFVRQYQQAGLTTKIPFYSVQTLESNTVAAVGNASIGSIVGETWTPGTNNQQSQKFVAAFTKRYGRVPSSFAAFSYDSAMLLDAAAKKTKGNVSDRKGFNEAIKTAQFNSVRGQFQFGKNNFPIQSYHIYRIAKGGNGKPEFKLLAENVLKNHPDFYAPQCPLK